MIRNPEYVSSFDDPLACLAIELLKADHLKTRVIEPGYSFTDAEAWVPLFSSEGPHNGKYTRLLTDEDVAENRFAIAAFAKNFTTKIALVPHHSTEPVNRENFREALLHLHYRISGVQLLSKKRAPGVNSGKNWRAQRHHSIHDRMPW